MLVGTVDGCGYDGQQNDTICDVCGPCQTIKTHSSQFFADFNRLVMLTSCSDAYMLRSGDFCGDDNRQTGRKTDYFTPAHAHEVKIWTLKG